MSWAVSGENAGLPTLIPRLFVPQLPARNTEPTVAISLSKKQEIALEVIKKNFLGLSHLEYPPTPQYHHHLFTFSSSPNHSRVLCFP